MTAEKERLLARIQDIRSMMRDAKSLDVIEMLVLALADCEQRVAWIDGEFGVKVAAKASERPVDQKNSPRAMPPPRIA